MNIEVLDGPAGWVVIRPTGRLNMVSAQEMREAIGAAVDARRAHVVLDLTDLEFIDSSGLGALISGLKTTRQASGDLRIANANEQVRLVLRLTNLERVLTPFESLEAALGNA